MLLKLENDDQVTVNMGVPILIRLRFHFAPTKPKKPIFYAQAIKPYFVVLPVWATLIA